MMRILNKRTKKLVAILDDLGDLKIYDKDGNIEKTFENSIVESPADWTELEEED